MLLHNALVLRALHEIHRQAELKCSDAGDVYCGLVLASHLRQQVVDRRMLCFHLGSGCPYKRKAGRSFVTIECRGSTVKRRVLRASELVLSAGRGTGRNRPLDRMRAGSGADGSICYNSRTGHGQMFWVGITCSIGIDGRFSCCPLTTEVS